jgi:solute carrier family 25 uncoupling protein 27
VVNVQRAALVNLGDLTTYDTIKHFLIDNFNFKDNYITHIIASVCSGLVAATFSTPADVIKTRIMNQPTDERGK